MLTWTESRQLETSQPQEPRLATGQFPRTCSEWANRTLYQIRCSEKEDGRLTSTATKVLAGLVATSNRNFLVRKAVEEAASVGEVNWIFA